MQSSGLSTEKLMVNWPPGVSSQCNRNKPANPGFQYRAGRVWGMSSPPEGRAEGELLPQGLVGSMWLLVRENYREET